MRIHALLAALVLGTSFSAHAAGDGTLSNNFAACMDKAGGVTAKMIDCMATETKSQDVKLNAAYQRVMATLSPERKKALTEVQRAWIHYRDLKCKFFAAPGLGTLATVNANNCFMSMTAERADELENYDE